MKDTNIIAYLAAEDFLLVFLISRAVCNGFDHVGFIAAVHLALGICSEQGQIIIRIAHRHNLI